MCQNSDPAGLICHTAVYRVRLGPALHLCPSHAALPSSPSPGGLAMPPKSTNPWELCHNAESHVTLGQKQQSRHGVNSNILTENLKRPLLALKVSRRSALGPFLEVSIGGEGAEWIPPVQWAAVLLGLHHLFVGGGGRVAVGRRGWIG